MPNIDKAKPSLGHMVECFGNYLKVTGQPHATFKQVVMSPDGLGWTGTYPEWLNGNHFRNKNMILKWQGQKRANAWHFKKVRRGHYFPTRGDSSHFYTRKKAAKPATTVAKPVQMEMDFSSCIQPKATAIKSVLIVPVTSVSRFHNIVDSLKGVLDDPDHAFLANLLCGLGV